MRTIALISQKGGAGKTTLAIALAVAAERDGQPSVLLDLDPQASAMAWKALREAETPVAASVAPAGLTTMLQAVANGGAGLVVIDTPPQISAAASAAAKASDFVLIPCRPSPADLLAIRASIALVRDAQTPAAVVINAGLAANPSTNEALEAAGAYGIPVCPYVVHQRIAHAHAWRRGWTAQELAPTESAASEITALYDWLRREGGPLAATEA